MTPEQQALLVALGISALTGSVYFVGRVVQWLYGKITTYIDNVDKRIAELEADKQELSDERQSLKDMLAEAQRQILNVEAERERLKQGWEQEKRAEIARINQRHAKELETEVKKAVGTVVKQHEQDIDAIKRENNTAIQIAVEAAVIEAVKPLNERIDTLTRENEGYREREAQHAVERQQWAQDIDTLKQGQEALRTERDDLRRQFEALKLEVKGDTGTLSATE